MSGLRRHTFGDLRSQHPAARRAGEFSASLNLAGDVVQPVLEVLLDVPRLSQWNPAIWDVRENPRSPADHLEFRAHSRLGPALLAVRRVADSEVELRIQTALLAEQSSWVVARRETSHGLHTTIKHAIELHGIAVPLLKPAFAGVAAMRLGRLEQVMAHRRRPL